MATFYKSVRPDLTSFHDQSTRWRVGYVTSAPAGGLNYLYCADEPSETTGEWPCRLFVVEPRDDPDVAARVELARRMPAHRPFRPPGRHEFRFPALLVVEELPSWKALGPNGEAVAAFIEEAAQWAEGTTEPVERSAQWRDALTAAEEAASAMGRGRAFLGARAAALRASGGACSPRTLPERSSCATSSPRSTST